MDERLSDPERELALHYAPKASRALLRALWRFDEKLGHVVAGTTEPTIGEMRLLWWREAVEALGETIPSEPLLVNIAGLAATPPGGFAAWGALAEGWFALLGDEPTDGDLLRFADQRGARLFALSAAILGDDRGAGIEAAGMVWALTDLARRSSDAVLTDRARSVARECLARAPRTWPRRLRPLGALAVLARRDAGSARPQRQGAPGRVMRMAWHWLTGR